jgi:hypothetical protein
MNNRLTPVLLAALLASVGFAAQAATSQTPSSVSPGFSIDLAKRGADDAAGDDRGGRGRGRGKDDGANHARRGRGADDAAGHQRRGRGQDDGPNHT